MSIDDLKLAVSLAEIEYRLLKEDGCDRETLVTQAKVIRDWRDRLARTLRAVQPVLFA